MLILQYKRQVFKRTEASGKGGFLSKKSFSPVRFRLKSPKRENKSMNFVEKRFLKKHEKRRKTKKTSDFRWFSGSNLFRPLNREAPTRIELVLKILQTSALPLGYGAIGVALGIARRAGTLYRMLTKKATTFFAAGQCRAKNYPATLL